MTKTARDSKYAAAELGCSIRTIHRMVDAGDLKPILKAPGAKGAYLFSDAAIERARQKRAKASGVEAVAS